MQIIVKDLRIPVTEPIENAIESAKRKLKLTDGEFVSASLYKRSIDARKRNGHDIEFVCSVTVECDISERKFNKINSLDIEVIKNQELTFPEKKKKTSKRPLVVGFGPCGMFAALMLAENGYSPIVIERGGDVDARRAAVDIFNKTGQLDLSSNIQFGEGGAGTFSDGKLVTRINDPRCRYVLQRFHDFGAPNEILTLAKPHIGTDKLITVVENLRKRIESLGGEVRFNSKLCDIKLSGNKIASVTVENNKATYELEPDGVILAVGHSARDTYDMLDFRGIKMIAKPFSVGVRVEHLQSDIDRMLYGKNAEKYRADGILPPGEYSLSYIEKQQNVPEGARGVYSFCMCPGGEVVAAASEVRGVVTNGMSRYARDGQNANSAIAVSVFPEDVGNSWKDSVRFQRTLEEKAFKAAGSNYSAPIELLGDFFEGKTSDFTHVKRVLPTYRGGNDNVTYCDMSSLLPKFISDLLKTGFAKFGNKMNGFDAYDTLLTGVETRTSSPLRILRTENGNAIDIDDLYPCGEGAGYAGGITSAAVDGIKTAFLYASRK